MSNINRFLNNDTSSGFTNDGTVNLYVNSVKVAGLLPNLPVMTDSNKNLFSSNIISVPSGGLVIRGQETLLLNVTSSGSYIKVSGLGEVSMYSVGSASLYGQVATITGETGIILSSNANANFMTADLLFANKSIAPQYAYMYLQSGGQSIAPSTTAFINFNLDASYCSAGLTLAVDSLTFNEGGLYNINYTDNITVTGGDLGFQASILLNGGVANSSLNYSSNVSTSIISRDDDGDEIVTVMNTTLSSPQIVMNSLLRVNAGDILKLLYANNSGSIGTLTLNNSTINITRIEGNTPTANENNNNNE